MDDFGKLVEKYEAMVFRTLARLTGEREGLEDMAQEVFLRLFRAFAHFRGESQMSTFLYRIVVNVVNDEFRERARARRASSIEDGAAQALIHPSAGPAVLAEQKQVRQAVDAALHRLAPHDRALLTLHYQEERSYQELTEIFDLPMGTVKTHLFRARERLKRMIEEWNR